MLSTTDIKTGLGGLRDVEFLAQGLQLTHAHQTARVFSAAARCRRSGPSEEAGILSVETAEQLSGDYLFLRRVEHFLQIYEDRQTHSLPRDPSQLRALARLMLGSGATAEQLLAKLDKRFERVQAAYQRFLQGLSSATEASRRAFRSWRKARLPACGSRGRGPRAAARSLLATFRWSAEGAKRREPWEPPLRRAGRLFLPPAG